MKKQVSSPRSCNERGVILIEAMVAVLIFSVGVLAIVGLQAVMVKNTTDSKYRSEASYIAQQRLGRMWIDPANLAAYAEVTTDISALLPNGTRSTTLVGSQVTVTVTWQQPGEAAVHNFTTTGSVAGG